MTWHRVCLAIDLPPEGGLEALVAGRVVALFLVDGAVHAIDGMCAHQGGPIAQGKLSGTCVTCPWHGWQYDVTSGVNLLSGKQMLEHFPVEVREQNVWIYLSDTRG